MKVLVVGGGGREHALVWKLARSRLCTGLLCAPGNPGIARVARCFPVSIEDVHGLTELARDERVDLVVVGPEKSLTLGLTDELSRHGIPCFGPSRAAAEIEGSKAYAKDLMARAGIATAEWATFDDFERARDFARARSGRVAVKADGLAAGKGVVVCGSTQESDAALQSMLVEKAFGAAGARVVVEERLEGEEASLIALCDGERLLTLAPAQDHKRVDDGDQGPNTGGMGAYSPTPALGALLQQEVEKRVLLPALRQLQAEGRPFRGALYAGLMLTADGPKVIEFNARLGDPETEAVLFRLESDLLPALAAAAAGDLRGGTLTFSPDPALTVVVASHGYPQKPRTGDVISGLEAVEESQELMVFHAGTASRGQQVVTAGGRVLAVTARGSDLEQARKRAYAACDKIHFEGMHFRRDIAHRALAPR